jgi:hypothetical protein
MFADANRLNLHQKKIWYQKKVAALKKKSCSRSTCAATILGSPKKWRQRLRKQEKSCGRQKKVAAE